MRKFICLILSSLLVGGFVYATTPMATGSNSPANTEQAVAPVTATLVAEQTAIQPGHPFWVGVQLHMAQGWDTYWKNPGDSGFPTHIEWQLPPGFKAGPIQWPVPQKFAKDQMIGFGYTNSVLLMTQITPPKKMTDTHIALKADVSWLACKESCEPGSAQLEMMLPVSQLGSSPSGEAVQFSTAKALLPQAIKAKVKKQDGQFVIALASKMDAVQSVEFFPENPHVIDYQSTPTVTQHEKGTEVHVQPVTQGPLPSRLQGVLAIADSSGLSHIFHINSKIQSTGMGSHFWSAFGLAFVGGMILNVMPCVLPVVALKIFSFVKMAQEKRRAVLAHGMVFTSGVLISFWALSALLFILRLSGQSLGWGFQLQEPMFVALLAGVLFLLGLSLFGVFELGTSLVSVGQQSTQGRSPWVSSFLSGVLATLVATPCTGPLLGPALGFAMTMPMVHSLLIFTSMGLGMAAPYLVFSAFPQLVRYLPKPGPWMEVFKQAMGFLMMGTVIWLVWVFGAQTGHIALLWVLVALLVMAIGAWVYGRWGSPLHARATRWVATGLAIVLIGGGGYVAVAAAKQPNPTIQEHVEGAWATFSPEKVAQLQAQGTPVFVDFTAKWCLICQVNKVVLHSSDVGKLFKEHGVVPMIADWTKKDPVITQQLEKMGRTGVPVYALYPPQAGATPILLPQNLTGNILSEYVVQLPH